MLYVSVDKNKDICSSSLNHLLTIILSFKDTLQIKIYYAVQALG